MSTAQSSKVRKWLAGCAVSLLAFVVLLGILAFAGYWWAATPGPQVDSEWFIGPETVGVFHVDRPFEDEGVLEFASAIALEMQKTQADLARSRVPALGQIASYFGKSRQDIEGDLRADAPRQVTLLLEAVEGNDHPQAAAVINLSRYPRLFRLGTRIYGWLAEDVRRYQGFELIPFEKGALTFVENTLIWSRDRTGLEQVLDRVGRVPEDSQVRAMHPPGEGFADPRWDLFGSVENRAGAIAYLLELWGEDFKDQLPGFEGVPGALLETVESLELALDVLPEDKIFLALSVQCRTENDCQTWKFLLESQLAGLVDGPPSRGTYRIIEQGATLQAEMEMSGLRSRLINYLLEQIPAEDPNGS